MQLADVNLNWTDEFNGAITVCDREGIIVYMNDFSIQQFEKYGGEKLMGTNLLDCHPEPSKTQLKAMLKTPIENKYTTEKNGIKKLIVQTPWMQDGKFMGVVEISFILEVTMPNYLRK